MTGPTFIPTVQLGQLLTFGSVLIGIAFFAFGSDRDAKEALKKVDKLELNMTGQFEAIKRDMGSGFDQVRKQIDTLPVVAQRLLEQEDRTRSNSARLDVLASKLDQTDRTAYDAREWAKRLESKIDDLSRTVSAPVPLRLNR